VLTLQSDALITIIPYMYLTDLWFEIFLQRCNVNFESNQFLVPGMFVSIDCQKIIAELLNLLPTSLLLNICTGRVSESVKCRCSYIHTHTTVLRLCGIHPGQPGWAGTRRNIHPLTLIVVINHPNLLSHLLRSMASSVFNPRALQSFSTISLQVFFGLPLGLVPSTCDFILHTFLLRCSYMITQ